MNDLFKQTAHDVITDARSQDAEPMTRDLRVELHRLCPRDRFTALFEAGLAQLGEENWVARDEEERLATGTVRPHLFHAAGLGMTYLLGPVIEDNYYIDEHATRADFDFTAPVLNHDRHYFKKAEAASVLDALAANPALYMGTALALGVIRFYGANAMLKIITEKPAVADKTWNQLHNNFLRIQGNAVPRDGRFLIAAAVHLHHQTQEEKGALKADTIDTALQWLLRAGAFHGYDRTVGPMKRQRCPADGYLKMLLMMPLFKGTPQEKPALLAFIEKAEVMQAGNDAWYRVATKLSGIISEEASKLKRLNLSGLPMRRWEQARKYDL